MVRLQHVEASVAICAEETKQLMADAADGDKDGQDVSMGGGADDADSVPVALGEYDTLKCESCGSRTEWHKESLRS